MALFVVLFYLNEPLLSEISPNGIGDHRSAGSATAVNLVQSHWKATGLLPAARFNLLIDMIFLAVYALGGLIGGNLIWQKAHSKNLKRLGLLTAFIFAIYGISDALETIAQLIQLLSMRGNDFLAQLIIFVRPVTISMFLIGSLSMVISLLWLTGEKGLRRHA